MQVTARNKDRKRRARTIRRFPRSRCPVANLLDLVGDKWSLLVVRDMFRGRTTYGQLVDSPERIPTNILADRLKRLEQAGVINRSPYRQRPIRYSYRLTKKGRDLGNILAELVRWGEKHVPGTRRFKD
jgi:DNA-binding HxlR family transcriptional regulator